MGRNPLFLWPFSIGCHISPVWSWWVMMTGLTDAGKGPMKFDGLPMTHPNLCFSTVKCPIQCNIHCIYHYIYICHISQEIPINFMKHRDVPVLSPCSSAAEPRSYMRCWCCRQIPVAGSRFSGSWDSQSLGVTRDQQKGMIQVTQVLEVMGESWWIILITIEMLIKWYDIWYMIYIYIRKTFWVSVIQKNATCFRVTKILEPPDSLMVGIGYVHI